MDVEREHVVVKDNPDESQYEAEIDGHLAFVEYQLSRDRIIFIHTEVPEALSGRGIAAKLAQTALDDSRARGRAVIPLCSYIAAYIRRHPEYTDLVPEEYRERLLRG